jgi:hypothetical protein
MTQQDTITLTGTYESRVAQLLRAARHQARLAQHAVGHTQRLCALQARVE